MGLGRLLIFAGLVLVLLAQHNLPLDLSKLASSNWRDRAKAVRQIVADAEAMKRTDVQDALIGTLEKEDAVMDGAENDNDALTDETYGDPYLSTLEKAVCAIAQGTDSQRAYDALLRSSYNPDSKMGIWLASRYANLPTLMQLSHSPSMSDRVDATYLIGRLLRKSKADANSPISSDSYQNAKRLVESAAAASNEEPIVRQSAVRSLGEIGDQSDRELLRQIAQSDSASYRSGTQQRFPVREEAAKAIQKIEVSTSPSRK